MKKLLIIACVIVALAGCKQSAKDTVEEKVGTSADGTTATTPAIDPKEAPQFKFEKEIYDFGVIEEGQKVQASFKFKNTGKSPLIITNATATCGCTVPEYPTTPLKPGEEGTISVVFNSLGKVGMQDKAVTITSNANPESPKLHMVGEVKEKK